MSPQEGFEHMKKLYAHRDQGRMVAIAVKEFLQSLEDAQSFIQTTSNYDVFSYLMRLA